LTAPVVLVVLAGCNGSDDKKWWNHSKAEAPKSAIQVAGQSVSVEGVDGEVDVLLLSPTSASLDTISGFMGTMKTAELKEAAPGAYIGFGDHLSLLSGTVTDLAGDGSYAIGKWTDGSDSSGATYNRNQARFWAVGRPVDVDLKPGAVMHCTLASKTQPAAMDGNTAPGTLLDASAEIRRASDKDRAEMTLSLRYSIGQDAQTVTLESLPGAYTSRQRETFHNGGASDKDRAEMTLSLRYSIGQDAQTVTLESLPGAYTSRQRETSHNGVQRSERYAVASRFVGRDPLRPYLAASYTLHSPTAGVISGMVALSCS